MAVPLFCQGYITNIVYFLQAQMVLFGGHGGFRLDQPLPFLHRSIYHDHFHGLFVLWMGNFFFFFLFSFLDLNFSRLTSDISWFRGMVSITFKTCYFILFFVFTLSLFYTYSHFPPFLTATVLIIQFILLCCVSVFQNVHCSFTRLCFYIR